MTTNNKVVLEQSGHELDTILRAFFVFPRRASGFRSLEGPQSLLRRSYKGCGVSLEYSDLTRPDRTRMRVKNRYAYTFHLVLNADKQPLSWRGRR